VPKVRGSFRLSEGKGGGVLVVRRVVACDLISLGGEKIVGDTVNSCRKNVRDGRLCRLEDKDPGMVDMWWGVLR